MSSRAPSGARGLKLAIWRLISWMHGARPFGGAWIETGFLHGGDPHVDSRAPSGRVD